MKNLSSLGQLCCPGDGKTRVLLGGIGQTGQTGSGFADLETLEVY